LGERVRAEVAKLAAQNPGVPVPIDLVTASASGLDPDISPAAAHFQIARIAKTAGSRPRTCTSWWTRTPRRDSSVSSESLG
jgi:K+-transporting ATPase c subunit